MINEVLFMQVRLFRQFMEEHGLNKEHALQIFDGNGIWEYIEKCYDIFHMSGDEYILRDICGLLESRGVAL